MALVMEAADTSPVGLIETKAYLRIAHDEEDALLAGLVSVATEACEAATGRVTIARDVTETIGVRSGWLRLGAAPVRSIDAIATVDEHGDGTPLPSDAYAIDIDAAGEGWVRLLRSGDEKRVQVSYRAGLAEDWNGVPETLRHGILRLTAHLYANRDNSEARAWPTAVSALWRPWRRLRLG